MEKSVELVIVQRLADLVNQVFQPTTGVALTIEDVLNRHQLVNERLQELLAAEMIASYATIIRSVQIKTEPVDAIRDGFIAQRNRAIAVRSKTDTDIANAVRFADARVKESQETERGEEAFQQSQKAILVASQAREQERIKLMALQAQAKYQDRLFELEMYRVAGNLDAELTRRFSDDEHLGAMPGWVMLAKAMGLGDLAAALSAFLASNTKKPTT